MFDTRVIPDFLSDSELDLIDSLTLQHGARTEVGSADNPELHHSLILSFFLDWPEFVKIRDILIPKLQQEFGVGIALDNSTHILESYSPYGIHSDVMTAGFELDDPREAAWTFIIPLADYDSHTLVFDQGFSEYKHPQQAIDAGALLPHGKLLDPELHDRYLSHCNPEHLRYLTVETVFKWRKGWLFAMDRKRFHVSDNYPKNGLAQKRGIVCWSTVPRT
jgi:hypothetical protein